MTFDIVTILRQVPEKQLRVFDLAEALRHPDGSFDMDEAGRREPELQLAESEATLYVAATRRTIDSLHALALLQYGQRTPPAQEPVDAPEYFDDE